MATHLQGTEPVIPTTTPHPLAGSLRSEHQSGDHRKSPCGSELAREGARSACLNIECTAVFASKLAPTREWR
ncbi:hypothetical protein SAMN04490188_4647 [Pseudomonas kilonensis]|uniref:Uncharacterized protein n=1 Tax=Pseudomonas kilonensis TaxID=132476 RepID=A0ABY0ZFI0_9PSED|nr:hypothetical protein SAMN04490188_4647 [Pseudomonas kilonensis]